MTDLIPLTLIEESSSLEADIAKLGLARLTIRFNDKKIIGATVSCDCPSNPEHITDLLRELLRMMEAADMPDPEVLGKFSPKPAN